MKYEKQLRPFLIGLGAVVGVGLFGSTLANFWPAVLGWPVWWIKHTFADVLIAGGSVLCMEYFLRKV